VLVVVVVAHLPVFAVLVVLAVFPLVAMLAVVMVVPVAALFAKSLMHKVPDGSLTIFDRAYLSATLLLDW